MQVAVVTFDGFNELDSFIASALINRCRKDGLEALITTPTPVVTSMNGVEVTGQRPMEFVTEADVVLIGSGVKTRDVVADDRLLSRLPLDPSPTADRFAVLRRAGARPARAAGWHAQLART